MKWAWPLLLLTSCATLNTAGMSEACKSAYNACLNGCPDAPRRGGIDSPIAHPEADLQIDVASCTNACNEKARKCK